MFFVLIIVSVNIVSTQFLNFQISSMFATGSATSQTGNVSIEVTSIVSIVLRQSAVDFGSGYVNGSCRYPDATTNATLTAGEVYENLNGCWTDYSAGPTSLRLENDGNRNVMVMVQGPSEQHFFEGYSGINPYNLTWRARDSEIEPGSCIGTLQGDFIPFRGVQTVCSNLGYDPSTQDEISIDIMVVIPADLSSGVYENSTIEFTALVV
jgi:hypothetical protein